eukprot:972470-Heterocapsa_arctica.AAC.1
MAVRAAEDHEVVEEGGRTVIVMSRLLGVEARWPIWSCGPPRTIKLSKKGRSVIVLTCLVQNPDIKGSSHKLQL